MPNVAYCLPEYDDLFPIWTKIRDCIAGQEKIKEKKDAYLPRPNASDESSENLDRYNAYLERALFFNMVGPTVAGLVGQVMVEAPKVELPAGIELLETDVDGAGVSLQQQATETLGGVIAYGRRFLLADYPTVEEGKATTKAQLRNAEIRPTITSWDAWDVINWRTITVGGQIKLSLVVLTEEYVVDDDGFELECDKQWRVLRLDQDGLYVMEEWIEAPWKEGHYIIKPLGEWIKGGQYYLGEDQKGDPEGRMGFGKIARYFPLDAAGKRLDYIPGSFCGVTSNNASPDMPPMRDLANLNIAHYRNSADYEETSFIAGQATPVLTGLTEDWVKNQLKGQVQLGSRVAIPLPDGASAELLQAQANSVPFEAMGHKEQQAKGLGAKLTELKAVQKTATETSGDRIVETSMLGTCANNVSAAYKTVLWYAELFVNAGTPVDAVTFQLNTNFTTAAMTAQDRAQAASEWTTGGITDEEYRTLLRRARVAYLPDDEWEQKREDQALTKGLVSDAQIPPSSKETNVNTN